MEIVQERLEREFDMVLPARPAHTAGWTEEQLAAIVTRDSLIGVARL